MSQTVDRALSILPLLAQRPADLGQVAERLGVHKSTALRLLRTLHEHGLVYRQQDQRYRLGARLFALAQEAVENLDVREIAHPHLVELNDRCGHTVHLAVYEEQEVLYIDKVESRYPVRMYSRIGKPVAITVAAVAKLLLADLTEPERRTIAEKLDYPLYTSRSTPNAAAALKELAVVREQGWATDLGGHEESINCIGAPIRGADGRVVAAMSVSAPNVVVTAEELLTLLPLVRRTAETISREYSGTDRPESLISHDREDRPHPLHPHHAAREAPHGREEGEHPPGRRPGRLPPGRGRPRDVVLRDPLVAGDDGHSLDLSLGDQYPVEGVAVQGRQPTRPHPVSRGDRQRGELTVAYALRQVVRAVQLPQGLLDGDLPCGDRAEVDGGFRVEEVLHLVGELVGVLEPPEDHMGVEQETHQRTPKASAMSSGSSSKSSAMWMRPASARARSSCLGQSLPRGGFARGAGWRAGPGAGGVEVEPAALGLPRPPPPTESAPPPCAALPIALP
ncbi:hypothetical protein SMICM304S_07916 [Streptomyces microflavus]